MNKYRVIGCYSYFVDGGAEEKFMSIGTTVVASSKDGAAAKALDERDTRQFGEEPSWLYGYPTVELLERLEPTLAEYWSQPPTIQRELRVKAGKRG